MKKKKLLLVLLCALISIIPGQFLSTAKADEEKLELPIVMYHQLSKKPNLYGKYVLGVCEFENDLKYLKEQGYNSITVSELLDWYDGGELPPKPFMITFDDGYESTAVYAVPLLQEYGYTAVVAVIGSVADLFTERTDHMLDYSHLSWEALRELSQGGTLEIQCHTFNMHKFSKRQGCSKMRGESSETYRKVLKQDLNKYFERTSEYGVTNVMTIAFPYGAFVPDTVTIIKEMGFQAAFTCIEKVNVLTGDREELYNLKRFNRPSGVSSQKFFSLWDK